jgi:hypothetical protein
LKNLTCNLAGSPNDKFLKEMKTQAYIGVPIFSSTHEVLGIFGARCNQALGNTIDDHFCLMEYFSISADDEYMIES